MIDIYLKVLRKTSESDSGQVAKAGRWAADEIERLREALEKVIAQEDSECVFTTGYERTLTTMTGPIGLRRCQEIANKALNND